MKFTERMQAFAEELLKPVNTALTMILGLYTLLWGLWIAAPWSVFNTAHLFHQMAELMPEWAWGGIAISVGILMIYGVLRHSYRSLTLGALVGYFHWLVISIMYFWGDWKNTGGITAMMISVYCGLIWLNITRNRVKLGF